MYPATHATVQVARQAAYAAAMSETPVIKFPGVFDANTADEAMRIILTAEDPTTRHRWATKRRISLISSPPAST
jgi:hypothetical protein